MMPETLKNQISSKVIIQILKLTRFGGSTSLGIVASHARCSSEMARRIVDRLRLVTENEQLTVTLEDRLRLAHEVSRAGLIDGAAKTLNWREFESFANKCFLEAGYESRKNVRIQDSSRAWEVDIVAVKAGLVLCVDCKHWNSPAYASKILRAAKHQVDATKSFLRNHSVISKAPLYGLPVVLTLLNPGVKVKHGTVLLAVGQLPDFLTNLGGYGDELPLISPEDALAENPIKEA